MAVKKQEPIVLEIQPMRTRRIIAYAVGTTPYIMHRQSMKVMRQLLYPAPKKNQAERARTLKQNPMEEFQGSCYLNRDPKEPALFHMPNETIQKAIANAALDTSGATKTEISRWCSVVSKNINVFGIPQMFTHPARQSGISRAPYLPTRPIFPRWAFSVELEYKVDPLNDQQVLTLLANSGMIVGCGDWRPQKGGPYGKFRLCSASDPEYKEILKLEGRAAQKKAFDAPGYFDDQTEELVTWFNEEVVRRRQDMDEGTPVDYDDEGEDELEAAE